MATYSDMILQIEDLRKQAEKIRREEFGSIVKSIKKQISDYGITAEDLGLSVGVPKSVGRKTKDTSKKTLKVRSKKSGPVKKVDPKYIDEQGNTWTGRGKQPRWVVDAIASGRSLDSLLIRQS